MPLHTPPPALRSRALVHPGPPDAVRIRSLDAARGRHIRLRLQPGLSLFDALVQPLYAMGVRNASTTLLGGLFAQLHYCVAVPDPSGAALVAYGRPIDAGRACMIFGNATLGHGMRGEALVHCHAAIRTEDGAVQGGHLLTERSIVGREPITVLVTSLDGIELWLGHDAETNIPLLQPYREPAHA